MFEFGVLSTRVPEAVQLLSVPLTVPSLATVIELPVCAQVPATLACVTARALAGSYVSESVVFEPFEVKLPLNDCLAVNVPEPAVTGLTNENEKFDPDVIVQFGVATLSDANVWFTATVDIPPI